MVTADIHADGIAVVRLDQAERRNALSISMRDAISETLESWTTDERVRVVVLTATGRASTSNSKSSRSRGWLASSAIVHGVTSLRCGSSPSR
jgi:1,4-dihydroxy-2-naphthoyl-CoA synthase